MTRTKHLALLSTVVAVAVVAPGASAADGTDGARWHVVDSNTTRYRSLEPSAYKMRSTRIRYGSVSADLRLSPAGYRYR